MADQRDEEIGKLRQQLSASDRRALEAERDCERLQDKVRQLRADAHYVAALEKEVQRLRAALDEATAQHHP